MCHLTGCAPEKPFDVLEDFEVVLATPQGTSFSEVDARTALVTAIDD